MRQELMRLTDGKLSDDEQHRLIGEMLGIFQKPFPVEARLAILKDLRDSLVFAIDRFNGDCKGKADRGECGCPTHAGWIRDKLVADINKVLQSYCELQGLEPRNVFYGEGKKIRWRKVKPKESKDE